MTSGDRLADRVHDLLVEAVRIYHDNGPAQEWLHQHLVRLDGPLRLAVTGPPGTGKSTLVNALVGESVAPVASEQAAGHLTWYVDGPQPRAQVSPWYGDPYELPLHRADRGLRLAGPSAMYASGAEAIHQVLLEWPSRSLRHTHLLDTPGLPPADAGWETAAGIWQDADAVLFLSRTLSAADLRRMPPVRGGWAATALPLHVVVVLSRADETAGGRVDALLAAKQIARRRRREPDLTLICQDVVAVSGLIGYAARALRQDEYDALAALAVQSRTDLEPHLLSVDRFRSADAVPLDPAWRERLLDRFGLTGVRLATTLVRSGAQDPRALAEALLRHSGLAELQSVVADLFSARRSVLKARVALSAIEQLAHREPRPQSGYLLTEVEQVVSEAHEFAELRLLAALRTRRAGLPAEMAVEARRLAGGSGASMSERLGLPAEAPPEELWARAAAAAERWRRESQEPGRPTRERRTAQVVLRSCEAILQQLG
ncbi:GTPase [Jidongwangia harbinensis]|uniref:GTPase n=1 Tax=Jidongwangia harbinensis TaxID=2878561 RepID=UPI001CD92B2C|nr:GTPase [Jidongwangia harbinensis]MCA2217814.1 50S ribosome-binding GTPase [Jidongwangia harbinensis]